jgi:hypothetical protein
MLANPEKIRSEVMAVRFTPTVRTVIEYAAEQAGIAPALMAYQLVLEGLAQRMLTPVNQGEAHQGRRA